MCDKCHVTFSELADGWQTYSATTVQRRKKGETGPAQQTVTLQMDACPSCAMVPDEAYDSPVESDPTYFQRLALEKENAELKAKLADATPTVEAAAPVEA
jgi:hypothetical protein